MVSGTNAMTQVATPIPVFVRERRWWLVLLALWAAIVVFAHQAQVNSAREQATHIAIEGARNMFRMVLLTRNWNASHGGVYVPVTKGVKPNPYLDHPQRDVTTTDGVAMTMVNPAYMTRLIAEMASSESGAIFRLTSLKPLRPGNKPDDWERESLLAFEQGVKETQAVVPDGEMPMLRYMAPLLVEESCMACHRHQGYEVGQIRGGISVSQRYAPIAAAAEAGVVGSALTHGGAFVLIALLGWGLLEMLRRRWFELAGKIREVADTQRQLLQSEKLASVGQLAAGVAHEINNPVGFVNSNLGTLKTYSATLLALCDASRAGQAGEADFAAADYDYLKKDLDALISESQEGLGRVRKIVADLKDFSRVDQAEWQEADLNAGIESTLNVVWHELKYKAQVVRDYGEVPPVHCIPAQINQVVMNLLVNAAQSIEGNGTITVRSGCDEALAWIEIEDSGRGMSPEVQARIFEPFFTTKPVGKGTGLGLSLAYDIVRKHGGRITVRSEPGHGSCFRIELPQRQPSSV
jgi:two-component system NtrC family sensor kinase